MDIQKIIQKLKDQNFKDNDSVIISSINHPVDAISRGLRNFQNTVNIAADFPDPYDNPNPIFGYTESQKAKAALDLAGLANTGGMPFSPISRGGTLGTTIKPNNKNYVSWSKTSDPIFNEEGDEIGEDPYVLIEKVFTSPEDRGKGIATQLMTEAMNDIKKEHPKLPIRLTPEPLDKQTDLERLIEFYKKFGFDEHPEGYMEY